MRRSCLSQVICAEQAKLSFMFVNVYTPAPGLSLTTLGALFLVPDWFSDTPPRSSAYIVK